MEAKLMHALVFDGGFARLKHVEVPVPSPGKDEVLIKLKVTSLNPFDWKPHNLRVLLRPLLARNSPLIPSTDVAGEVVEVGSAVKNFKPGDKVVTILSLLGGGLSEYAVAKENLTVSRPVQVSAAQGAGLTADMALTQSAGLNLHEPGPCKNILITAASGGVGHYAVQLAKLGNHHVTATCGARNIDVVKGLGADVVLDYKAGSLRSPSGRKYDAVIHCAEAAVPWSAFVENLGENGVVVDLNPGPRAVWTYAVKKLTLSKKRLVPLLLIPRGNERLKYLVELVKDGKIRTIFDSIHPLNRAEEGWEKCLSGHAVGKIVVQQQMECH